MKAIQIIQPGNIGLISLEEPALRTDEVLVKLKYVGFCGSDMNTYLGRNPLAKMPVVPGHEIGGEIAAIGTSVPEHLTTGMACTINPYTACGNCPACRNDRPNACQSNETLGVQRDGAMKEWIAVPWQKAIVDPQGKLSAKDFALVEPMSVGFHAVARAAITDQDIVAVIGCGMIGIGALVRAVMRGATVIAIDRDDEKLALAKSMGAAYTINSNREHVHEQLQQITHRTGPDVMIEAVGAPATYQLAVAEVAFTGRVVCIGYAKENIAFETKLFVQKELDIRGSRNALPADFRAVMEYMKRGTCPTDQLISAIYKPEQAAWAMDQWVSEPGKVFRILIDFNSAGQD